MEKKVIIFVLIQLLFIGFEVMCHIFGLSKGVAIIAFFVWLLTTFAYYGFFFLDE